MISLTWCCTIFLLEKLSVNTASGLVERLVAGPSASALQTLISLLEPKIGSFAAAWQPPAAAALHPAWQGAAQLLALLEAQQLRAGFEILTVVVHISKIAWVYSLEPTS